VRLVTTSAHRFYATFSAIAFVSSIQTQVPIPSSFRHRRSRTYLFQGRGKVRPGASRPWKDEAMPERLLVLVRHGESEWNLKGLFTGRQDVDLTATGIAQARAAGRLLKTRGFQFDIGVTSALKRAQRSLALMLDELGQGDIPTMRDAALNERDYGDLTGLNKDEARKTWGDVQVQRWRRAYDVAPPGGESLRDTAARVLPYYINDILPHVLRGERTLVTAHGNSLRALVMVLEKLSPEQLLDRELATGAPLVFRFNADSTIAERIDLAA
jgi:2,3-bisphosphoglycerate-dependent phosphoglycerate mutase